MAAVLPELKQTGPKWKKKKMDWWAPEPVWTLWRILQHNYFIASQ
jgi:hypothetical protein